LLLKGKILSDPGDVWQEKDPYCAKELEKCKKKGDWKAVIGLERC